MLTEEERQQIIDAAVEKALLLLPTVMGNLMAQQASYSKLTSQFYKDHPNFAGHKDIVAACVEMIDGKNPTLPYKEKLEKAVPEINKQIAMAEKVSFDEAKGKVDRSYEAQRPSNHGEV